MTATDRIFLPKYYTTKAIVYFGIIITICLVIFINRPLKIQWVAFDIFEVVSFFMAIQLVSKSWLNFKTKLYETKLFWTAFFIRLLWILFSYFYYEALTGRPFEFEAADSYGYHSEGVWLAQLLQEEKFSTYMDYVGKNYADMGYPFYLGNIYYLAGDHIIIPRIIKALLGAATCFMTYKIALNNFDEATGRMAGIIAMIMPNLIYYSGLHVKETEMVFIGVAFIYSSDKLIRARKIQFNDIALVFIAGGLLFFFRTVLAGCLIGSLAVAAIFTTSRVSKMYKRIIIIFLVIAGGFMIVGTPIADDINEHIEASDKNQVSQLRSYSTRTDGNNKLAHYGSKSIFFPLMLMAPFPTLIDIDQPNAMMLGGAFFTRNVYAFFVMIALYALYKQKRFKYHILLLAAIFSYIFVLASSGFALSERFHLPLLPFLAVLAAYGISQMNKKNKKYYVPYLILVSVIVIGWNLFKVAGRS
ncbi:hypothetical protein GCM10028805_61200 [Spirosoma harenae]